MRDDDAPPPDPADALIQPDGHALRPSRGRCPRCGAPPADRVASSGFGVPIPICRRCGYEFRGEVWMQP